MSNLFFSLQAANRTTVPAEGVHCCHGDTDSDKNQDQKINTVGTASLQLQGCCTAWESILNMRNTATGTHVQFALLTSYVSLSLSSVTAMQDSSWEHALTRV